MLDDDRYIVGVDTGVRVGDSGVTTIRIYCSVCKHWNEPSVMSRVERPRQNQDMGPTEAWVCRDVCFALARLAWRHLANEANDIV